jgi:hypothetical protein
VPDAHGLGGDAELAGDLGLVDTGREQLGRAEPTGLEPVAFSLCRRAARHSWQVPDPRLAGSRAPTRPSPLHSLNPTPKSLQASAPAGQMMPVLGAARPYVPTVSEPEVYGEGRTERIDERYPAARR